MLCVHQTKEYSMSRDRYYSIMRAAAQKAGVVAMLPWQLVPWQLRADEGSGYDFDFGDPSSKLVTATLSYVVRITILKICNDVWTPEIARI